MYMVVASAAAVECKRVTYARNESRRILRYIIARYRYIYIYIIMYITYYHFRKLSSAVFETQRSRFIMRVGGHIIYERSIPPMCIYILYLAE